jgi:hypothetical protein
MKRGPKQRFYMIAMLLYYTVKKYFSIKLTYSSRTCYHTARENLVYIKLF